MRIILFGLVVWCVATWLDGDVRAVEEFLWTRTFIGVSEACYLPAAVLVLATLLLASLWPSTSQ